MLLSLFSSSAYESHAQERPVATVESATRVAQLKEAVVAETQTTALLTATVTSGINGLSDKTLALGPDEIRAYAPGNLERLALLTELLMDADYTVDEPIFLGEFVTGARFGDRLLASYYAEAESIGTLRANVLHRTGLAESWRQNCHLALLALQEVDAFIQPDLPEIYVQNSRVLTGLLASAKSGLRPCIDKSGRLHLPPLPQQRRWPRRALLQNCQLRVRGTKADALARDISAGGLGLDHAPPLKRGDLVAVELVSGRVLNGLVAWSSGPQAGLRFPTELKPNDPLLIE